MKNLEMYGNLGRVLETSEGPLLVSRDFDTRQLDYTNTENAFVPRYLRGTELTQEDINSFRRGEVREIAIVNRDGSVNIVPYQYNAVFRKPMEVLTIEQRNALATKLREQRDMERIISSMPETANERTQYPQAPKQSAEQTAGQVQAPAAVPEQNQQGQAAETAGQGQAPAPDLFGAGQTAQGKTQVQGQTSPQGQKQPGAGQKSPRPEVATPTPKAQRKTGQHV